MIIMIMIVIVVIIIIIIIIMNFLVAVAPASLYKHLSITTIQFLFSRSGVGARSRLLK